MSEPTGSDRATATGIVLSMGSDDMTIAEWDEMADAIARALAAEREKAWVPFRELAERLQEAADNWTGWAEGADTLVAFADQIDAALAAE